MCEPAVPPSIRKASVLQCSTLLREAALGLALRPTKVSQTPVQHETAETDLHDRHHHPSRPAAVQPVPAGWCGWPRGAQNVRTKRPLSTRSGGGQTACYEPPQAMGGWPGAGGSDCLNWAVRHAGQSAPAGNAGARLCCYFHTGLPRLTSLGLVTAPVTAPAPLPMSAPPTTPGAPAKKAGSKPSEPQTAKGGYRKQAWSSSGSSHRAGLTWIPSSSRQTMQYSSSSLTRCPTSWDPMPHLGIGTSCGP